MDGSRKNVALAKSGWSDAVTGGWNASERTVAGVRRIPLQGLTLVNQDPAYDPSTIESAASRAILYIPPAFDASKPVEVLFHLHGHNIGYRQRAGKNIPGAGTVRDVEVDKIADQLARSGRPMIAVLVQGSLAPAFGSSGTTGFDVNTTLEEILNAAASAGVWPSPPALARAFVSAHGAGGDTVGALLGQAGQPRLPRAMGGLFLFNAIDAPAELASVTRYLTDRLTYDSLNIQNLEPNVPDQLAYLRTSPRLRGFYDPRDGACAANYATLKQSLIDWFARNADDVGGTASATYQALSANYQIAPPAGAGSESLVGETLLPALA